MESQLTGTPKILTFLHSGDMGDIIAGMATVKEICAREKAKAHIILDASGGFASPCVQFGSPCTGRLKFNETAAEFLTPLLATQPYVHSVDIDVSGSRRSVDYDLNIFREVFNEREAVKATNKNLLKLHQYAFGLPIGYKGAWLTVLPSPPPLEPYPKLVISRTPRYTSSHVVWNSLYRTIKQKEATFIGTDFEWELWKQTFDYYPPKRLVVKDALEMAQAVAGAEEVICNGTLLYWIAVGIGHPNILHEAGIGIPTTLWAEKEGELCPNVRYMMGDRIVYSSASETMHLPPLDRDLVRFPYGDEAKQQYVELRASGPPYDLAVSLVTTQHKQKQFHTLLKSDGNRNWVTPEELKTLSERYSASETTLEAKVAELTEQFKQLQARCEKLCSPV